MLTPKINWKRSCIFQVFRWKWHDRLFKLDRNTWEMLPFHSSNRSCCFLTLWETSVVLNLDGEFHFQRLEQNDAAIEFEMRIHISRTKSSYYMYLEN